VTESYSSAANAAGYPTSGLPLVFDTTAALPYPSENILRTKRPILSFNPRKLESGIPTNETDAATQTTLNGKQALFLAVALFVHG
jgi:hypothetical protein